jgi:hypothetical protein
MRRARCPTITAMRTLEVVSAEEFETRHGVSLTHLHLREHEVLVQSSLHEQLTGRLFTRDCCAQPWKRAIVRVRVGRAVEYLRMRSAPVTGLVQSIAVVHSQTRMRLVAGLGSAGARSPEATSSRIESTMGECDVPFPPLARALHYWRHPEDQARIAFKLGLIGVVLGVIALPSALECVLSWFR